MFDDEFVLTPGVETLNCACASDNNEAKGKNVHYCVVKHFATLIYANVHNEFSIKSGGHCNC